MSYIIFFHIDIQLFIFEETRQTDQKMFSDVTISDRDPGAGSSRIVIRRAEICDILTIALDSQKAVFSMLY